MKEKEKEKLEILEKNNNKIDKLEKENQEMRNLIDNHFPAMFELLRQRIELLEKNVDLRTIPSSCCNVNVSFTECCRNVPIENSLTR